MHCVKKKGETFTHTYLSMTLNSQLLFIIIVHSMIVLSFEKNEHFIWVFIMFFPSSFMCWEQLCRAAQRDLSVCQHFITVWQHRLRWQMTWIFTGDAVFYAAWWRCTTCALEIKPSGEHLHFWVKLWVNISCPLALLEPVSNGSVVLLSNGALYWLRTRSLIQHSVSECGWEHHS